MNDWQTDGGVPDAGQPSGGTSGGGQSSSQPSPGAPDGGVQSSSQPPAAAPAGGTCTPACQNLSSQAFTQSDQAAASAASNRPLNSASATCGSAPQASTPPCDVDDLVLNEVPGSKTTAYKVENWSFVEQPPKPSSRAIALTGTSRTAAQPKLQVVSDRPGAEGRTQISVFVYPIASCGPSHVLVTAMGPNGVNIEKAFPAQGTFDFPVSRYESSNAAVSFFERFITIGIPPNSYIVSVTSCGNRVDGTPVVTGGDLTVEVYPYDQYELSLTIPPLKKKTITKEKGITTTETTERSATENDKTTVVSEEKRDLTRRSTTTVKTGQEDEEPKIELKHNGQPGTAVDTIKKIIKVLQDIKAAMTAIQDAVRDYVPQMGPKFEYELAILSGKLMIACGWAEATDWRTYFGFSIAVKISVVKVSLTLSFGVKAFHEAILLRAEAGIEDAEVPLDNKFSFNSPDSPVEFDVTLGINIPAKVQVRAAANLYFVKASIAVGVKTGFSGKGGVKFKSNKLTFPVELKWEGVSAFLKKSKPGHAEEETPDTVELVGEKPIVSIDDLFA